jgi:arabinoxylan arabinofuranohydrolase
LSFVGVALVDGQTFNFTYSNNPSSNPWIRQTPGSDPAAVVWGDTVWVYVSQDANLRLQGLGPNDYKYDYMDGYRALSSTDMVNWVDHGEVFHSRNVSWGFPSGGWMWAPSAHWNGKSGSEAKYYLYYPHKDKDGVWRIGVATAPTPAGPFTDIGSPIDGLSGIDPHIFKDDDGQVYLYYNQFEVVKLKDNLIEIAEPVRKIDYGGNNLEYRFQFEEGSFMHKYNGKYYYSYSHWHATEPTMGYYAIGSSPYGPFEWKGGLTGRKSGSQDHHSIIQFKGDWYYFTHMDTPWKERSDMNWYGQRRISCYQKMYYNDDGTIRQVNPNAWALNADPSSLPVALNTIGISGTAGPTLVRIELIPRLQSPIHRMTKSIAVIGGAPRSRMKYRWKTIWSTSLPLSLQSCTTAPPACASSMFPWRVKPQLQIWTFSPRPVARISPTMKLTPSLCGITY